MNNGIDKQITADTTEDSASIMSAGASVAVTIPTGSPDSMSDEDIAVRREVASMDRKAGHEPGLSKTGVPAEVLEKLLPGDDVIELEEPAVGGSVAYRFTKRAFDVVSCGTALVVLAIPMAVIALKIKSESPGPIIYAQKRIGLDGREFNIYKFRSMYIDAESSGARWSSYDDPRVTPFV